MTFFSRLAVLVLSFISIPLVTFLIKHITRPGKISNRPIDHLLDGIIVLDYKGRIRDVNPAARRILALSPDLPHAAHISEATHDWARIILRIIGSREQQIQITISQNDRQYKLVATRYPRSPLSKAGKTMIIIRDVTEQKIAEEDARKAYAQFEKRTRTLEITKELAETLNQTLPPEKALSAGLAMVAQQVGATSGWLLTLTPDDKAVLASGYNLPPTLDLARHKDHAWPLCACLRESQAGRLTEPIRVFNCERLARTKSLEPGALKHHLSIPVRASGRAVGILNLIVPTERTFDDDSIRLLSLYGDQFGGAIERARLFEEVHTLAITDSLTGLYNRRHFYTLAEAEMERIFRYHHPLSIAMLDVDWFKSINDTYGHLAGDQVLRAVARICKEEIRRIDILGRYGGEELIALMPETSHESAVLVMERLRQHVSDAKIHTLRGTIQVTISVGMSHLREDEQTDLQKLIDQADQALYEAKQGGRNLVRSWAAPLSPGQ
jgi:diguanylate cyclase (GGDEF)-like protein